MRWPRPLLLVVAVIWMLSGLSDQFQAGTNDDAQLAQIFLQVYDASAQVIESETSEAYWTMSTNITDENQEKLSRVTMKEGMWKQYMSRLASEFNTSGFSEDMQRQFRKIKDIGVDALDDAVKLQQVKDVKLEMSTVFDSGKVCLTPNESECLQGSDAVRTEAESTLDEDMLRRLFVGWADAVGPKLRELFPEYVNLSNEAARMLGYADTGDNWRSSYESETFEQDMAAVISEVHPLIVEIQAFFRRRFKLFYEQSLFPESGHIPQHLLNGKYRSLMMPYPNKPSLDVTAEMQRQNYTTERIFRLAEDFFVSLGLSPMPKTFWEKSLLEQPNDGRVVSCHPTSWDFFNGVDFRILECTEPTEYHFTTAHHEMGHIQYFLQYKDLPTVHRAGANPGFHEAVGDVIALSVGTPTHLHGIGLFPSLSEDNELDINYLMTMAFDRIVNLPFAYMVDQWRWSIFRGDTSPADYNKAWWNLRCEIEGLSPPVERSEGDFDAAVLYQVAHDYPAIDYFVSFVIQFQFHKALCEAAGHVGPLHRCDIYNSVAAGDKLKAMLKVGSSKKWTIPFQEMTGTTRISAAALVEYFQPLMDFLKIENGWDKGWDPQCPITVTRQC